jgi:hypothetical protein
LLLFFLVLGYNDLSLIDIIFDTIYCDGGDTSASGINQPTNLDSLANTNISSNTPLIPRRLFIEN